MLCLCHEPEVPYTHFDYTYLGTDEHFAEIHITLCKQCGTKWLLYSLEDEGFSNSGRWYRGVLNTEIAPAAAADYLGQIEGYIYGGSYFGGQSGYGKGPLVL